MFLFSVLVARRMEFVRSWLSMYDTFLYVNHKYWLIPFRIRCHSEIDAEWSLPSLLKKTQALSRHRVWEGGRSPARGKRNENDRSFTPERHAAVNQTPPKSQPHLIFLLSSEVGIRVGSYLHPRNKGARITAQWWQEKPQKGGSPESDVSSWQLWGQSFSVAQHAPPSCWVQHFIS